jgi:hypothetical protein
MKITALNNLKELLDTMKITFGPKALAVTHRSTLNSYILNVNYDALDEYNSSSKLGIGKLDIMILGKNS